MSDICFVFPRNNLFVCVWCCALFLRCFLVKQIYTSHSCDVITHNSFFSRFNSALQCIISSFIIVCAVVLFLDIKRMNSLFFLYKEKYLDFNFCFRSNFLIVNVNIRITMSTPAETQTTETVSPSNIELSEKKDDGLKVNKEKKRTVRLVKKNTAV